MNGQGSDPDKGKPVAGLVGEYQPGQQETAFAVIEGQPYTQVPQDLYIPPDALKIILETFEGPLDLLLYLIKRHNLDILNINVARITQQYMVYIELMESLRLELAAEYLVMAAMLAELKSRTLLPRHRSSDEDEDDPRADLIKRLQEYERYKQAAEQIDELPRLGRELHTASAKPPQLELPRPLPGIVLKEVMLALAQLIKRAQMFEHHHVQLEKLSTREKMSQVLSRLQGEQFIPFVSLFSVEEGRLGVVVTFLAIMELDKESLIDLVQNEVFGTIHIKARVHE